MPAVQRMQACDAPARGFLCDFIDEDVIGSIEARFPRRLVGDDPASCRFLKSIAPHHARNLGFDCAVDDQNPVDAVSPCPGFDQQRNREDQIGGGFRCRLCKRVRLGANHRVQHLLKRFLRRDISEHKLTHPAPVKRAGFIDESGSKLSANWLDGLATCGGQFMCNRVGIDDVGAEARELIGGERLPAADASRESNAESRNTGTRRPAWRRVRAGRSVRRGLGHKAVQ